ncbi:MAG: hypothetical protein ACE5R3_00470 [Nitrosopumilaceae archaeon]
MSSNKAKCIQCDSMNTYVYLGSEDPNKLAYRCRNCGNCWSLAYQ